MKRTSHTAALATSLVFGSVVAAVAADDRVYDDVPFETARTSEERLLGSDDEAMRYLAHLPFTREIAVAAVVGETLASSLAEARVPATVILEARKALVGAIDFEREMDAGARFYVRYRQPFTVDGTPVGTAQLIWLELRTTAKGTVALHRFRPNGGTERLWLATGEAAGNAALRLPLDVITVSSGFGLRPDPLDKPGAPMGPLADSAPLVAAAPPPEPPPPPKEEPLPPPRRPTLGGLSAFGGARDVFDSGRADFHRRRAEPEPVPEVAAAPEPQKVEAPRLPRPPSRACSCMTGSTSSR